MTNPAIGYCLSQTVQRNVQEKNGGQSVMYLPLNSLSQCCCFVLLCFFFSLQRNVRACLPRAHIAKQIWIYLNKFIGHRLKCTIEFIYPTYKKYSKSTCWNSCWIRKKNNKTLNGDEKKNKRVCYSCSKSIAI